MTTCRIVSHFRFFQRNNFAKTNKQNKTKQIKSSQIKTKNKTKQNKAKQNKTKQKQNKTSNKTKQKRQQQLYNTSPAKPTLNSISKYRNSVQMLTLKCISVGGGSTWTHDFVFRVSC